MSALVIAISVTDSGSPAAPRIKHPGTEATHGRGLGIVTALADNVEIHGDQLGRTVTAELLLPNPGAAAC